MRINKLYKIIKFNKFKKLYTTIILILIMIISVNNLILFKNYTLARYTEGKYANNLRNEYKIKVNEQVKLNKTKIIKLYHLDSITLIDNNIKINLDNTVTNKTAVMNLLNDNLKKSIRVNTDEFNTSAINYKQLSDEDKLIMQILNDGKINNIDINKTMLIDDINKYNKLDNETKTLKKQYQYHDLNATKSAIKAVGIFMLLVLLFLIQYVLIKYIFDRKKFIKKLENS